MESIINNSYAIRQTTNKNLEEDERRLLQGKFLPVDYHQLLFKQFESSSQGHRTVTAYAEEFYWLFSRCRLFMTKEQRVAKYTIMFMYSILKYVLSQNVFSLDEAHNLAFEAEEMMNWSPPFM